MKKLAATLFALSALWNVALAAAPSMEIIEETDSYRLVRHAGGETQVPLEPERIVALDEPVVDALLILGIQPVGAPTRNGSFQSQLAPRLEGTEPVGNYGTPNLEAIVALEPDLILRDIWFDEEVGTQVARIAPTVVIEAWGTRGPDTLLTVGQLVGKEEQAQTRIAQYQDKVAAARERLSGFDEPVALMRLRSERDFYLQGVVDNQNGLTTFLYEDLGLTPDPLTAKLERQSLSLEVVPSFEAEHLFVSVEDEATYQSLLEDPLWQNVPAVQKGQVYPVDPDVWVFTAGITTSELMIDDVLDALASKND